MDPPGVALQRPVGDRLFDQPRIGHQDIDVVIGPDPRRARPDLHDGAANADVLDLDIVADRDHPVEDQEQARDELLDHPLQAQTHAYAQAPAKTARDDRFSPAVDRPP